MIVLLGMIWLVFRKDIVEHHNNAKTKVSKAIYAILALGVYDMSERAHSIDKKAVKALCVIGIPGACLLTGYAGFIFGGVKGNPWWSTPLMPIIFVLSAMVAGAAVLAVLYVVATVIRRVPIDYACLRTLLKVLLGFLVIDVIVEGLELWTMAYESE